MRFFSLLDVSRSTSTIGIRRSWGLDVDTDFEVRRAAMVLLESLEPGVELSAAELDALTPPNDTHIAMVVPRLVEAGYLRQRGAQVYELVHPVRLADRATRLATGEPDQRPCKPSAAPATGDVVIVQDQLLLLPGSVLDYQCRARTKRTRRCLNGIAGEQRSGWLYIRHRDQPDVVIGVYDVHPQSDDEADQWRAQHCVIHHKRDHVDDYVAPEWATFDPTGYVWADPDPDAWTDHAEPVTWPPRSRALSVGG